MYFRYEIILWVFYALWWIFYVVQIFFSYGIAYRYTKRRGDNGVALCGWMLVFSLASFIPGLLIGLYVSDRKKYGVPFSPYQKVQNPNYQSQTQSHTNTYYPGNPYPDTQNSNIQNKTQQDDNHK